MTQPNSQGGYVLLVAVLVVGAISLTIGLSLLVGGVENQRSSSVFKQSLQASNLAEACVEEALQQIHDNTSYSGSGSQSLGQGDCAYTVTIVSPGNVRIDASGTVLNVVKRTVVEANIGPTSITINDWQ